MWIVDTEIIRADVDERKKRRGYIDKGTVPKIKAGVRATLRM